jgi:hypothetical protein
VTDVCAGVPLATFESFGTLGPGELRVAGSLSSATVNKTFTAVDSVSGESREFTVSATWAATSPRDTHTSSSHTHNLCNATLDMQNMEQHFREAQASGSVADGGTTTSLDSGFGFVSTGTTAVVNVSPLPDHVCH